MTKVYADNAATTYPKPDEVGLSLLNYITKIGTNISRGNYEQSYSGARVVYETRELLCELFNFQEPLNVIFTSNITESFNIIIKGFLNSGDHVIISSMEHNAVVRPLFSMSQCGVKYTVVPCSSEGKLDSKLVEEAVTKDTKLVIINHVSNVCGTIQNLEEISNICRRNCIDFVIDSAQSAGILPIDFQRLNLSALPFTGHKGLFGPQGIGGILLSDNFAKRIKPFREGGTGSFSEQEYQPGIFGLNAGLKYIRKVGIESILGHEQFLGSRFLDNVSNIKGIKLHGINSIENRTAVFSLSFDNVDSAEAGYILDTKYGVMTRTGIHCSPLSHKTLGTFPQGTVRFSFGNFNTKEEIDYICSSLSKIIK
jgi:cysteine desulfurase family protein